MRLRTRSKADAYRKMVHTSKCSHFARASPQRHRSGQRLLRLRVAPAAEEPQGCSTAALAPTRDRPRASSKQPTQTNVSVGPASLAPRHRSRDKEQVSTLRRHCSWCSVMHHWRHASREASSKTSCAALRGVRISFASSKLLSSPDTCVQRLQSICRSVRALERLIAPVTCVRGMNGICRLVSTLQPLISPATGVQRSRTLCRPVSALKLLTTPVTRGQRRNSIWRLVSALKQLILPVTCGELRSECRPVGALELLTSALRCRAGCLRKREAPARRL